MEAWQCKDEVRLSVICAPSPPTPHQKFLFVYFFFRNLYTLCFPEDNIELEWHHSPNLSYLNILM